MPSALAPRALPGPSRRCARSRRFILLGCCTALHRLRYRFGRLVGEMKYQREKTATAKIAQKNSEGASVYVRVAKHNLARVCLTCMYHNAWNKIECQRQGAGARYCCAALCLMVDFSAGCAARSSRGTRRGTTKKTNDEVISFLCTPLGRVCACVGRDENAARGRRGQPKTNATHTPPSTPHNERIIPLQRQLYIAPAHAALVTKRNHLDDENKSPEETSCHPCPPSSPRAGRRAPCRAPAPLSSRLPCSSRRPGRPGGLPRPRMSRRAAAAVAPRCGHLASRPLPWAAAGGARGKTGGQTSNNMKLHLRVSVYVCAGSGCIEYACTYSCAGVLLHARQAPALIATFHTVRTHSYASYVPT